MFTLFLQNMYLEVSPLKRFHDNTLSSKFLRLMADETTVEAITVIAAQSAYSYQACDKPSCSIELPDIPQQKPKKMDAYA
ncbi:hypothetical protein MAR_006585 [Mya arenaria]|uniref:Uncharacterized protein n=1 Tax=Mya arenaria TaxID=6604 RepID=A0ABY7DCM3_MYAAR|nr:hypothetical protein MAR_006585 [Mya arenaria]